MNNLHLLSAWLLASSLRASLLALAIICLQAGLGRWLPARQRYILWLPMLLVLLAPALPASRLSIENYFARQAAPLIAADASPIPSDSAKGQRALQLPSPAPAEPDRLATGDLLAGAWLLGTWCILGAGIYSYLRTLRRLHATGIKASAELTAAVAAVSRQLGLRNPPRILISTGVESPAVTGLLRPVLLLPSGFSNDFTPAEARLVLLHELTHLKAGDLPINWLLCFLQALHWFNPVLWFAFARIRADREAACDASVLSADSIDTRAEYGRALIKLQASAPRLGFSLAFVGMFDRSGIRSRIRAVGRHRRGHPAWSIAAAALIAALLLIGATRAQSAAPANAGGNHKPEIEIDTHIIEMAANTPIDLRGEEVPEEINANTPSTAYVQSMDASAILKRLKSNPSAHVMGAPRMTSFSGLRVTMTMGNEWAPAPGEKPIVIGETINMNPTVTGRLIKLEITFSQTKLTAGRMLTVSDNGDASHPGAVEKTGTLIVPALPGAGTHPGATKTTGTLELPMPPNASPHPGKTGNLTFSVPAQVAVTSTVSSKVVLKDGQSVVLTGPDAGTPGASLVILITARLLQGSPAPTH